MENFTVQSAAYTNVTWRFEEAVVKETVKSIWKFRNYEFCLMRMLKLSYL